MKTKNSLLLSALTLVIVGFSFFPVYAQDCGSPEGVSGPGCNPYCGDGICDLNTEKCSCEADCGQGDGSCDGEYCGDGTCDAGEDSCSCEADCGYDKTCEPYCGDGICNLDTEKCSCEADCGAGDGSCSYCGDYKCDSDEDYCSCQYDCSDNPKVCSGIPDVIIKSCGAGFTSINGVCVPSIPGVPRILEDTRCLGLVKTFTTRPNYNLSVVEFNRVNRDMCSNGGLFYYTGNSSQVINNRTVESFFGFCSNVDTIDIDPIRCTYSITNIDSDTSINSGSNLDSGRGTTSGTSSDDSTLVGDPPTTTGTSLTKTTTTSQSYLIRGVVIGNGIRLPGIGIEVIENGITIAGTTTDTNGNYVITVTDPGVYEVRPISNDNFIFPTGQAITLTDTGTGTGTNVIDFSGINLVTLDPATAELLRRGSTDDTTTTDSGTSINDWINGIINRLGGSNTGTDDIVGGDTSHTGGNSFSNIFSENSLISLLQNGYIPLANSYSPVGLSLIQKYANQNSICGDGIKEEGETCDDGINNGRGSNYCSSDCLYFGEVRFTSDGSASDALGNGVTIGNGRILQALQVAGNTVGNVFSSAFDVVDSGVDTISGTLDSIQNRLKQKIIENTSPETRKVIKEVAKYSVAGVVTLLVALAAGLQFMIYKSQWTSYTVQEGDTLDSLGSKFTMTSRALKAKNSGLKKGGLRPGMKINVRNRHFIEKDYLDQLKMVLKDGLDKRKYGHMTSKIEKIFAKK